MAAVACVLHRILNIRFNPSYSCGMTNNVTFFSCQVKIYVQWCTNGDIRSHLEKESVTTGACSSVTETDTVAHAIPVTYF